MSQFILLLIIYLIIFVFVCIFWYMLKRNYWRRLFPDMRPCPYIQNYKISNTLGTRFDRVGIASYSLYGNYSKYTPSLYQSLDNLRQQLPTWQASVYVSAEIPPKVIQEILARGAEVNIIDKYTVGHEAAVWRFLPAAGQLPFVSLDADDIFDLTTLKQIQEWLASGKQFAIFHKYDFLLPMVASGWGSRNQAVPNMSELIDKYCETWFGFDEAFLHVEIWPLAKQQGYWKNPSVSIRLFFVLLIALLIIFVLYSLYLAW